LTAVGSRTYLQNDGLVEGPDGWLYGTIAYQSWGGYPTTNVFGSIYKVSTNGQSQTIALFRTSDPPPGGRPLAGLTLGSDGYLYGTLGGTSTPWTTNYGTVFRMTTNGEISVIATLDKTTGVDALTRLLLAADGSFYGTTATGVFRVTTNGELTALAPFSGTNVPGPRATALIQSREGCLYGVANAAPSVTGGPYSPFVYRYVDPPVLSVAADPGTGVTLNWNSFTDAVYEVQYKSSIDDVSWTPVSPNVSATGTSTSFYDDTGGLGQRSYRVVLLP
jgi:hypothetical protein